MFKYAISIVFLHLIGSLIGQSVLIYGKITDEKTELPIPFAKVQFAYSKKAALADSSGNYNITYLNDKDSDSIIASFIGYHSSSKPIKGVQSSQPSDIRLNINFRLKSIFKDFDEITVKAPDELPSTILIRKVIANKDNNNKDKLDAFEYKLYNKIQFDLNNIGDDFKSNKLVNKLD
ncbi:MAG: carboxypeptidase-like regulatory domain-containing protein, partial [Crocinitomicaceae bacterium]|nr:carboxypeptidase-like regulatory domain-containing protein [Crocinitomicaceae bacterium]